LYADKPPLTTQNSQFDSQLDSQIWPLPHDPRFAVDQTVGVTDDLAGLSPTHAYLCPHFYQQGED